jgi:hypothetical protein
MFCMTSVLQVMRVLSTWASGIERKSITPVAQHRLYDELQGGKTDKPWKLLPGTKCL